MMTPTMGPLQVQPAELCDFRHRLNHDRPRASAVAGWAPGSPADPLLTGNVENSPEPKARVGMTGAGPDTDTHDTARENGMAFNVKKRGKITYYTQGDQPVLANLVTRSCRTAVSSSISAGLTGGYSARGVLGRDELVTMDPKREIPLVFQSWERWLQEAENLRLPARRRFPRCPRFRLPAEEPRSAGRSRRLRGGTGAATTGVRRGLPRLLRDLSARPRSAGPLHRRRR